MVTGNGSPALAHDMSCGSSVISLCCRTRTCSTGRYNCSNKQVQTSKTPLFSRLHMYMSGAKALSRDAGRLDDLDAAQSRISNLQKELETALAALAEARNAVEEAAALRTHVADLQSELATAQAAAAAGASASAELEEAQRRLAALQQVLSSLPSHVHPLD